MNIVVRIASEWVKETGSGERCCCCDEPCWLHQERLYVSIEDEEIMPTEFVLCQSCSEEAL